jgi:prepilin-type N-terminal cleavage/methylation domain-containing protein
MRGFSLVELSIVLVILGLLTGGILTAQSLIHSAELRKFTTQMSHYKTATHTFRDKYMAIPGDMRNAKRFWGAAGADDSTCRPVNSSTLADSKNTCNGDGDGTIEHSSGDISNLEFYNQSWETFRYWQHLANAGLIEGMYSGVTGTSPMQLGHVPGVNSPRVPMGDTIGWMMMFYPAGQEPVNVTSFETVAYGHSMVIGSINNSNAVPTTGFMSAEDAFLIDMKMDDGMPASGIILPTIALWGLCTTAATTTDITAQYNVANGSSSCGIIFRNVI